MAHYFLGNFDESARLRQAAIDKVAAGEPEIHEMWGNLGDSYRQAGNEEAATEAYLRAAEIAERDHLRGNAPVADRAARAYYYTILEQLAPARVPASVSRGIADQLDDIEAALQTATAHRRMAQIRLARSEPGAAWRALDRAAATCRGYARMPDFAGLAVAPGRRDGT